MFKVSLRAMYLVADRPHLTQALYLGDNLHHPWPVMKAPDYGLTILKGRLPVDSALDFESNLSIQWLNALQHLIQGFPSVYSHISKCSMYDQH
jgi:hypothetical protein